MDRPYQPPASNFGGHENFDSSGRVSQRTTDIMARTKGWVRFIAVLMFVNFGISAIQAMLALGATGGVENISYKMGQFAGLAIVMLFYLYPALKLNSYASRIGVLLQSGRAGDLEAALNEHRAFWRYVGTVALIILCIGVIAAFIGILGAVMH